MMRGTIPINWRLVLSVVAILGAGVNASGCVSSTDLILAEITAKKDQCRQQNYNLIVERSRCMIAAEARLAEIMAPDLVAIRHAHGLVLAEKMDRKEITVAEGTLELAKVQSQLTSEALGRAARHDALEAQLDLATVTRRTMNKPTQTEPARSIECTTSPLNASQTRTECKEGGIRFITSNPALR